MPHLLDVFHEGLADLVSLRVIGGSCGFVLDAHLAEVLLQGVVGPGVPWQSSVVEDNLGRRVSGEDGVEGRMLTSALVFLMIATSGYLVRRFMTTRTFLLSGVGSQWHRSGVSSVGRAPGWVEGGSCCMLV